MAGLQGASGIVSWLVGQPVFLHKSMTTEWGWFTHQAHNKAKSAIKGKPGHAYY
jgi:hypothetical protein